MCGIYFMKERLNVMPHNSDGLSDLGGRKEKDACEKLLLLDAFTWSPGSEEYEQSTRIQATATHEEVLSAPDEKSERILCYRKR